MSSTQPQSRPPRGLKCRDGAYQTQGQSTRHLQGEVKRIYSAYCQGRTSTCQVAERTILWKVAEPQPKSPTVRPLAMEKAL